MWIFTQHGFISAVCARTSRGRTDRHRLVVRARTRSHLHEVLATCHLDKLNKVEHTPDRDYAWRVVLSKPQFVALVGAAAADIDYPNFKSQCQRAHPDDRAYHQLLATTWHAGYDMQVAHLAGLDNDD